MKGQNVILFYATGERITAHAAVDCGSGYRLSVPINGHTWVRKGLPHNPCWSGGGWESASDGIGLTGADAASVVVDHLKYVADHYQGLVDRLRAQAEAVLKLVERGES